MGTSNHAKSYNTICFDLDNPGETVRRIGDAASPGDDDGNSGKSVEGSFAGRRHSYRKATIGSTCAARLAGTRLAASATRASRRTMPMKAAGSVGLTP